MSINNKDQEEWSSLFDNCLSHRVFPNQRKKHKYYSSALKAIKHLGSIYCSVSLYCDIFEQLLFDSIYVFLDSNCLLNNTQPSQPT